MKLASINLKNITLETGGKSPLLVFEDADLDQAIKWSHLGIMSLQGQVRAVFSPTYIGTHLAVGLHGNLPHPCSGLDL